MTDLFSNSSAADQHTDIDPDKVFEELVGDGKKFKSAQDLAKAKLESDRFIEQLKGELAGLREDLNARIRLEEVVDRFNQGQNTSSASNQNNQNGERDDNQSALTPDKIAELVANTIKERETERTREQNIDFVRNELTKIFGSDYVTHLNRTAADLGMSQDQVRAMAASQPKALLRLVGAEQKPSAKPDVFSPPRSSYQPTLQSGDSTAKTFSHYEKIRKEDPARYWTPAVQNEMHREAMRLGENFYK